MMDRIEPALTAEEWERERSFEHRTPLAFAIGHVVLSDEYNARRKDGLFALMAAANSGLPDDDPRKITRLDIAKLRNRAVGYEHNDDDLLDIAAKLEALLPPA